VPHNRPLWSVLPNPLVDGSLIKAQSAILTSN
jgi:hypothetical protein